jgi:recombination protein RecR
MAKNKGLFEGLIAELSRLPGVGRKSAQRLVFALMSLPEERAKRLGQAIIDARTSLQPCQRCHNATSQPLCEICDNPRRDSSRILVVEDPGALVQIERSGGYRGLYHVLGGVLSPLDADHANAPGLASLRQRLEQSDGEVKEVILATSPTLEGEATALFVTREIRNYGVEITRIAYGLPVGMELEFADEVSLIKSIEGRRTV